MQVNKIGNNVFKGISVSRILHHANKPKPFKHMNEACFQLSNIIGQPASKLQEITQGADFSKYSFLRTMANKFSYQKFHNIEEDSQHILNIYSMVENPSVLHVNIVKKSRGSFEFLEKIFSNAKDEKTLQYVEDLQYGALRDANQPSKIIADLLSSKNSALYINKPESYSSYLKLHADNPDVVSNLDKLVESGKYSRFRSDAQLAISKLMNKKPVKVAMAGKTNDLEKMYSKERAGFLTSLVKSFISPRKSPKEETKSVVVKMYGSTNPENAKLRNAVIEHFKNAPVKERTAEIVQMQTLFNKIDKDKDVKSFVQKAITRDLKIGSISELNEVLDIMPVKKANVFFNNAKRIIERSTGDERKTALVVELENPFFESKAPQGKKARIVRMFADKPQKDDFFTKMYKVVENKINQYRYYRMSA